MKAMLLHVPKGFSSDDWRRNYINIMPMGLFSIAHFANRRGHDVKVMNAAVHQNRETALRLVFDRMENGGFEVVGLPIHWHLSAYDACRAAEEIKRAFPAFRVVLGGITATVLAEELLEACGAVDAVVRGDGELPFAAYLDELARPPSARDLSSVPNLCWRQDGRPATNAETYVATQDAYSAFDFSVEDVLFDLAEYAAGPSFFDVIKGIPFDFFTEKLEDKVFFLNVGRGCSVSCVYCAGSSVSFARYFHRDRVMYRSVDAVLETVKGAARTGFRKLHVCFDAPCAGKDDYFVSLFTRTREEVPHEMSMLFETYDLPSRRFLDAFSSSFQKAIAILSPCFFDSEKMKRFKGYHFSRAEMERALEEIRGYPNLEAFVYFAITPLEEWGDERIAERVLYMRHLAKTYGCKVSAMPVLAEPGSPWVSFPELFGEPAIPLTFRDFWEEWQKPLDRWSEKLCHLPGVNRIVERIDELTQNASLASASLSRQDDSEP
jgi:hypothetical protein